MAKVIHPELVRGKGLLMRMEQEAKVLAGLQHVNIVQVFWAGRTSDSPPLFYYVMEKLNGHTLRRAIRKGTEGGRILPIQFVLTTVMSLLRALAYAHQHHVIHRDVKPDNVFLHRDEER